MLNAAAPLYFTSTRAGKREIHRLNIEGQVEQVSHTPATGESWSPVLGPGSTLFFVSNREEKREFYQLNPTGQIIRVTHTPGSGESWSPALRSNGTLYFTSNRGGKDEIYLLDANGETVQITNTPASGRSWSPVVAPNDVLYWTSDQDGNPEIYRFGESAQAIHVTHTPSSAGSWAPMIGKNGTLFFTSKRDGKAEIYRLALPMVRLVSSLTLLEPPTLGQHSWNPLGRCCSTPTGGLASDVPLWYQYLRCDPGQQHFQGIEYCQPSDGAAYHVIVIDLHSPGVRLETVMPEGLNRNDERGTCRDVNRSTKQLGGPGCDDPQNDQFYPVMSLGVAKDLAPVHFSGTAVVVNSDYGAKEPSDNQVKWRDHGPEGFTVAQGNRLDGELLGDGDNNAENRPWLAVSQEVPLRAELKQFARGEDRGERPDWIYTAVGGAPWMIREGEVQYLDIDPNTCTGALGSCYVGAAQTAAGLSQDGRWLFLVVDQRNGQARLSEMAEFMQGQLGVYSAIKFDGGGSTQLWYDGAVITPGDGRQLSEYLAVTALPGNGINVIERPALHASPVSVLVYDFAMPGDTAELVFNLRNEGTETWSGSGYEFVMLSGNLPGAPESMRLLSEVPPGNSVSWIVRALVPNVPGVRSVRYQMHAGDEPFEAVITGYVFVLPEGFQNLEQQIREEIEQWQQQGQQTVDELIKQIGDMIAKAVAQQAQSLLDRLLQWCNASVGLLGANIAVIYLRRKPRQKQTLLQHTGGDHSADE